MSGALLASLFLVATMIQLSESAMCTYSTLADADRQKYLDANNAYRSTLVNGNQPDSTNTTPIAYNPKGQNMYKMIWDCDLERGSQEWANTCSWGHSTIAQRNSSGENIFCSTVDPTDKAAMLKQAADSWWVEVRQYWKARANNVMVWANDQSSGHFTQMAWGKTYKVGCGVAKCPGIIGGFPTTGTYVVCRYMDPGNYNNAPVYEPGTPGTCNTAKPSTIESGTNLCVINPAALTTAAPTTAAPPGATTTPGPAIPGMCSSTIMTDAGRQKYLDANNAYRSTLVNGNQPDSTNTTPIAYNPKGQNMYKLSWDCDLERGSQEWANACVWGHSTAAQRNNSGENIFASTVNPTDVPGMMQQSADSWWVEVRQYWKARANNVMVWANDQSSGHFTQMAWGKTYKVGCGIAKCPGIIPGFATTGTFVVCRYMDPGNYNNAPVYEPGTPGTCSGTAQPSAVESGTNLCVIGGSTAPTCPTPSPLMDDAGRKTMVDAHNNYRSKLASGAQANKNGTMNPTGKNMLKMVWDCDLETAAYKYANSCLWQNSPVGNRPGIGENIQALPGAPTTASAAMQQAADTWWGQATQYWTQRSTNVYKASSAYDKKCNGFTQMAYGKTFKVGCAMVKCNSISSYKPGTFVVCRYNIAGGNVDGQVVYEPGTPGSCPSSPASTYDATTKLCKVN